MITFCIIQQDAPAHRKSPTEGNDNKNQQGTSQQTPSSQINRPPLMGTPPGLVTKKNKNKNKNLTFNGLFILVFHAYMLDFYKITRFEIPKMSPPSFWW